MRQRYAIEIWSKLWAALLLLSFSLLGWAQTYSYRADTFSYDTPSASAGTVAWHTTNATACSGYPDGDDDYADLSIAGSTSPANDFTFTFAGVAYTSLRIYSNGMLTFGTDNSGMWRDYTNSTLPAPAAGAYSSGCPGGTLGNAIIAYWTDIVAGTANSTTGASIRYELLGTKPNRRFVISWVNVKLYNSTTRYNFQVILYETPTSGGNSSFKYQYTSGSSTGSAATVGVQVSSTDYTQYSYNQAYIDPTAGTAILWYPSSQFTGKQAEYRFDEGLWSGTAGEVLDTATGSFNAVKTGLAVNTPSGKVCRGGSFPANVSNAMIDAVATPIAPTSRGAIDFWYKSNANWNAASSDAMLFDATAVAGRPFYLMKTAGGVLKFQVTDSAGNLLSVSTAAQTFSAGTWQHVGVAWNINPGTNQTVLNVFLNGLQAASFRGTSAAGAIAALSTVYIGDNRTSSVTPSGGSGNSANGFIDEVNFYATEINAIQAMNDKNATRTSCTSIDHFHIVHPGSIVNCDMANVTIEAHDASHGLISLAGTTIGLTTSTNHGNWQLVTGSGGLVNTGNGVASYTYSNESSVVLGLTNSFVESTNINVAAGTYTEHSGVAASCVAADYTSGAVCDADLAFTQAGFRIVDAAGNFVTNQVAGVGSGTYYLQAVRNTCNAAGACTGVCSSQFPAGTAVDVGLAYECSDPATCQSGQTLTFTPGASAGTAGTIVGNASGTVTASSASSTYTTKSLVFNAASPNPLPAVPFTFNYTDVGKIKLWARYPATSTSPTVAGSSVLFVVKPAGFILTEIKPTANQVGRCAVATTPAPALTCSSVASDSALFAKAGEAFSVTVTAVNGSGNATPNYGQEAVAETVKLTPAKVISAMGNVPAVAGSFAAFASGKASGTAFSWDEVGIITLTPSVGDADYLGAGGVTGTTSGNVGRFVPDHIDSVVTDGCGSFTYSGQPMGLELSARNLANNLTTNYSTGTGLSRAVTLSQSQTTGNFSPATVLASTFTAGVSTTTPSFAFATRPTVPTVITVAGQDADGVSLKASTDTTKKQTTEIRSGRLYLANAYGSEFLPLPVPVLTQYWQTGWKQNRQDACTVLTLPTAANAGLVFSSPPQTSRNKLESGEVVAEMNSSTAATATVSAGSVRLVLRNPASATLGPGAGNYGYVDVIGNVVNPNAWLPSTGNSRACFGACGPRSPVIYFRERF